MAESKLKKTNTYVYQLTADYIDGDVQNINESEMNSTNNMFTIVLHQTLGYLPIDADGYLWTFRRSTSSNGVQFFTRVTATQYVLYMRKFQNRAWGNWVSITFS